MFIKFRPVKVTVTAVLAAIELRAVAMTIWALLGIVALEDVTPLGAMKPADVTAVKKFDG